jgi:hypothetical protein
MGVKPRDYVPKYDPRGHYGSGIRISETRIPPLDRMKEEGNIEAKLAELERLRKMEGEVGGGVDLLSEHH